VTLARSRQDSDFFVVDLVTASPTNTYAMFWTALSRYKTALFLPCNNECNVSKYNSLCFE